MARLSRTLHRRTLMPTRPTRPTRLLLILTLFNTPLLHAQAPAPPAWAYVVRPADQAKPLLLLPAPDWHPAEHSPMPAIVARGRQPGVFACGYCHRADGTGGPENASLAGLSAEYMTRQIADFRSGARTGSEPLRLPTTTMAAVARAATDSEIAVAVRYFAAQRLARQVAVIESDTVPATRISGWLLVAAPGEWEPVGQRIVEVPDDQQQFERRDTHAQRTAYVPPGSLAKGKALVATMNCPLCHGPALQGLDPAPAIAGRSPTYIVRQLYDFKHGARAGTQGAPMRAIVAPLSLDDMIAAAAYVASLPP